MFHQEPEYTKGAIYSVSDHCADRIIFKNYTVVHMLFLLSNLLISDSKSHLDIHQINPKVLPEFPPNQAIWGVIQKALSSVIYSSSQ